VQDRYAGDVGDFMGRCRNDGELPCIGGSDPARREHVVIRSCGSVSGMIANEVRATRNVECSQARRLMHELLGGSTACYPNGYTAPPELHAGGISLLRSARARGRVERTLYPRHEARDRKSWAVGFDQACSQAAVVLHPGAMDDTCWLGVRQEDLARARAARKPTKPTP